MERAVRVPCGAVLPRWIGLGLTDGLRLRGRVRLDAVRHFLALRRAGGAYESLGVSPRDLAPRRDQLEDAEVVGGARQVAGVDGRVEAAGVLRVGGGWAGG